MKANLLATELPLGYAGHNSLQASCDRMWVARTKVTILGLATKRRRARTQKLVRASPRMILLRVI
jgi:hypothetical protein